MRVFFSYVLMSWPSQGCSMRLACLLGLHTVGVSHCTVLAKEISVKEGFGARWPAHI